MSFIKRHRLAILVALAALVVLLAVFGPQLWFRVGCSFTYCDL